MSQEATAVNTETQEPPSVQDYLEMALQTASDQGINTSELMGIFFYYAHSIAESYRQDMLRESEQTAE